MLNQVQPNVCVCVEAYLVVVVLALPHVLGAGVEALTGAGAGVARSAWLWGGRVGGEGGRWRRKEGVMGV